MVILRRSSPRNKVSGGQIMVDRGHEAIRPVDFESRRHARLPVEVLEMPELRARADPATIAAPRRPSFPLLLLTRSGQSGQGGRCSQVVDFRDIPARPGRLVQVRPGQVYVFDARAPVDATLLLSEPGATAARPWLPGQRAFCDLDEDALASAESLISVLRRQQARFLGDEPSRRLMIALFDGLLALFDQAQAREETSRARLPALYLAYCRAIEAHLAERHHVGDYAQLLGYSARSITRACREASGRSAKRILTDRLVLEAKRLLVHTDASAAAISARLGFSEPTNFGKFFLRNTGQSPASFRRQQRGEE